MNIGKTDQIALLYYTSLNSLFWKQKRSSQSEVKIVAQKKISTKNCCFLAILFGGKHKGDYTEDNVKVCTTWIVYVYIHNCVCELICLQQSSAKEVL